MFILDMDPYVPFGIFNFLNFFVIFSVKSNDHDLQNGFTQEKPETQAKLVASPRQRRQN